MPSSRWSKLLLVSGLIALVLCAWEPSLYGDRSFVQPSKRDGPSVFVVGGVTYPGQYQFEPGMTVADALSAAGGIPFRGRSDEPAPIEIRRKTSDGLEVKPAKLSDKLLANDTVAVGRVRKGRPGN